MKHRAWIALASLALLLSVSAAQRARPFAAFVNDYFDAYFAWRPSEATADGLHQYDMKLENRSAAAVARRLQVVNEHLRRLEQLRKGDLNPDEAIDAEVLDGRLRAEVLDLETLRTWRHNPMEYFSSPSESIDLLMKRSFAPPAERLRSVIARLKAAPALFAAARANVENPPREFTELAIQIGAGSVGFFRDTLHEWAKEAARGDAGLLNDFDAANAAALKSLEDTVAWMKAELQPRSNGKYAIGAESFSRKLRFEELVDMPLDKLLVVGEAALRLDQEAFGATAKQIDPTKSAVQVMDRLKDDHATEDDLIPAARRTIEKTRQFLIDKHIVTVPSEVRPTVTETPVFARYGSGASMDTPGPYEKKATEAFYYVTPTEKDWDAKHKEQHLRTFNLWAMQITTIHEAYPGHYIQFLYANQYPTKTRKLAACNSNAEGWAHYCEQMLVEEGYGGGDPRIKLAQLSDALLRDCRFVVGIKLHTQGMTVAEGQKFFEQEGHQEPAMAYEEARRGAYDPTYLVYTLGKLQIYKLRADYRKLTGDAFKLETFHNEFVRQGGLPIELIRRIFLPGDQGPAL